MSNLKRLHPWRTLSTQTKQNFYSRQSVELVENNLLDIGLVLGIDYYGNQTTGFPPYSLLLRIDRGFDETYESFFPPLLPIHTLALPQVGEQVWIFYVNTGDKSKGFWITRVNLANDFASNSITQYDFTSASVSSSKYGIGIYEQDLKETNDIEPNNHYNIPIMRIKPGDVFTHGRSNTHILNTFDAKNKKGIIDLVTEVAKEKANSLTAQEFHISNGARVLIATKHNIDSDLIEKDLELKFHADFNKSAPKTVDESFVNINANQIRLLSVTGGEINHVVLAETQAIWIQEMFKILKTYIDGIKTEVDNFIDKEYSKHTHMAQGPTSPTISPNQFETFKTNIDNVASDADKSLDNHFKLVINHHSKNIAVN